MAIGSIINLGGGGGSLGGKGMIIVDTATMTAGDVVRVRDVFDSQNVQNKSVVTTGTPLYFEVNPYCYYKVCMVQDINDTPTEIGGMYTTIDVGQTVYVNVLDKTTLGGIQGILNAHQENELLNIGDEVEITENGVAETWLVTHINAYASHSVILSRKFLINQTASTLAEYDLRTSVLNILSSVYSSIAENDRQYIKDKTVNYMYWNNPVKTGQIIQKVWIPTRTEAGYTDVPIESSLGNVNFSLFSTQASRVKTIEGGTAYAWHLATNSSGYSARNDYILGTGAITTNQDSIRVLPCIMLTADS